MEITPAPIVTLEQIENYLFNVSFGLDGVSDLVVDEPAPLGSGKGPSPSRLLAAALADCLCASLLFCLRKSRLEPGKITASVTSETGRNEQGRLRIKRMSVLIDIESLDDPAGRFSRCLEIYEDFCVVTATVRAGMEVTVTVRKAGVIVHTS